MKEPPHLIAKAGLGVAPVCCQLLEAWRHELRRAAWLEPDRAFGSAPLLSRPRLKDQARQAYAHFFAKLVVGFRDFK